MCTSRVRNTGTCQVSTKCEYYRKQEVYILNILVSIKERYLPKNESGEKMSGNFSAGWRTRIALRFLINHSLKLLHSLLYIPVRGSLQEQVQ